MSSTYAIGSSASERATSSPARGHLLQLYEDDDFLCDLVTEYLLGGLQMDERLVVIASDAHRAQLVKSMRSHPWDFAAATASGRVTMIDADATLDAVAHASPGDPDLVAPLFADLLDAGEAAHTRVYGELAGMSWSLGQPSLCTELERSWNQLAQEHSFTLLCSYRVNLMDSTCAGALADICSLHTQVLPSEHCVSRGRLSERLRYLFMVEQSLASRNVELQEARNTEQLLRQTIASLHAGIAATGNAISSSLEGVTHGLAELDQRLTAGDAAHASELLSLLLNETRGMSGLLQRLMAPTAGWSTRPPRA